MPEIKPDEESEAPASKPLVGIIYPPPEVRNIVDKTANFVARNGVEFEIRIKQNEQGNPKFNFLNADDPYHAYYQHKMKEFKEGKGQEAVPGVQKAVKPAQQKVIEEIPVPTEPPPDWEFSADPPSISAFDLDLVKLTAQFVARNGRQFLTTLMSKEQYNAQFDFLRPQHHLFQYFTKLVEQYTKILIPPKGLLNKLQNETTSPQRLLDRVNHRYYWARHQERQRKKLEEEAEKERVAFAQVDWHDFVLVETVDFPESDPAMNYPPPVTLEQLGSRILAQQRYDQLQEERRAMADDTAMEIDEEDDDEEITMGDVTSKGKSNEAPPLPSTPAPPTHPPLPSMPPPPAPPGTQPKPPGIPVSTPIRRDYDPKAPKSRPHAPKGPVPDEYMVSPITGERIRADKFEEHMRYGLLDPRWREQKNKEIEEKREQEEVFAAGTSVSSSLKHLAERRTDIFGQEETYIGKKVGEEDKSAKETWEGHAPSAQTGVEEQIAATLRAKGLAPDDSSARMSSMAGLMKTPEPPIQFRPPHLPFQPEPPRMPFQPPPPPPPPMAASLQQNMPVGIDMGMSMGMGMGVPMPPPSEEMPAKRSRIEQAEGDFIPEQQFIASHPGPVIIKVQVASVPDKTEWNLKGQTLSLTLPIEDLVSNIKAKLSEMLGIPPGKQKLQMGVREYTTVKAVDMLDTGIPALHNH